MRKQIVLYFLFCLLISSPALAQRHLRLMSYNIRNGKGMDNKTDYERTATVLRSAHADIIALQEIDSATKRSNREDVLQILAEKTSMSHLYGAAIPYQDGKYGVGILFKQKLLNYCTVHLPGKEEERVLLVAEFKKYIIFCTHLSLTDADRLTSASIINKEADKFNKPIYLLGDLNAEPTSNAITLLKEKWNLLTTEAPTFPASEPKKCIDYIFSIKNKKIKVISAEVINDPMASDHRPVLAEVKR